MVTHGHHFTPTFVLHDYKTGQNPFILPFLLDLSVLQKYKEQNLIFFIKLNMLTLFDSHSLSNQDHDVTKFYLPWLTNYSDRSCLYLRSLISPGMIYELHIQTALFDHVSWSDIVCLFLTFRQGQILFQSLFFVSIKLDRIQPFNCSYFILSAFYK